ncbi:hypothetical protein ACH5RR_033495 [Cinchona calisaya]|uniref:Uncharacterized protein n=1 Tax=Cinchona calisaya TaxID=153742 RepID=A0ABD2YRF0_9GENT
MVMEVVQEDMGDGNMQCTDHPYKNSSPGGGICAFCLQEKLGKLVSSSFSVAIFPSSSSSSSSPSFRSVHDFAGVTINTTSSSSSSNLAATSHQMIHLNNDRRNKKKKDGIAFKRSKSTTTHRRSVTGGGMQFLDADQDYNSPHKKGFWSFLYSSKHISTTKKAERKREPAELVVVDENDEEEITSLDDDETAFDRKVSRSKSVGCGSRSFSGDIFERISTGFGDCTIRRVESHREGNNNNNNKPNKVHNSIMHRNSTSSQDCIKESVKCGGIFSGFMITSSSSSSYWISSSTDQDNGNNGNGGGRSASTPGSVRNVGHGRSHKSWGWALASPMRAFGKPTSNNNGKREASNKNNATPNLSTIPSLLAVRG